MNTVVIGQTRPDFVLLRAVSEVVPLVPMVRTNADKEKDALGFLPWQVYDDAARDGNLTVAVEQTPKGSIYLGHILHKESFPHARIYQVFVVREARKFGIGQELVKTVVDFAQEHGYLSVIARVADDLSANTFWEKVGFLTARSRQGGATRKRTINVRVRELNTPHLFRCLETEPVIELPFRSNRMSYTPVYAIDLNVFFDVIKRRTRAEYAAPIISAALNNVVRVVVTAEFAKELRRNSDPTSPDPVLEFALQLPTIPAPDRNTADSLERALTAIVFPNRQKHGGLTANHSSDLAHLATAVYHTANGFITADDALVAARREISARYGLDVIRVQDFAKELENSQRRVQTVDARLSGNTLRVSEADCELRKALVDVAARIDVPQQSRDMVSAHGLHAANHRSLVVSCEGAPICGAFWDCRVERNLKAYVIADEDSAAVETAVDALLYSLGKQASSGRPASIELVLGRGQVLTEQVAIQCGFSRVKPVDPGTVAFQRFSIGYSVTPQAWVELREELQCIAGMSFPEVLPEFTSQEMRIPFSDSEGRKCVTSLRNLETAFSPALFVLPGRAAALVPIRVSYADELLNTSLQASLLPRKGATLFHHRVYYSSARNARVLCGGTAVVFYESGGRRGRSAAVAIARVLDTFITPKSEVAASHLRHGVLESSDIETITAGQNVAVTTFDNVITLAQPVPFKRLRALGCVDGSNLVSAQQIAPTKLLRIVQEGMTP